MYIYWYVADITSVSVFWGKAAHGFESEYVWAMSCTWLAARSCTRCTSSILSSCTLCSSFPFEEVPRTYYCSLSHASYHIFFLWLRASHLWCCAFHSNVVLRHTALFISLSLSFVHYFVLLLLQAFGFIYLLLMYCVERVNGRDVTAVGWIYIERIRNEQYNLRIHTCIYTYILLK